MHRDGSRRKTNFKWNLYGQVYQRTQFEYHADGALHTMHRHDYRYNSDGNLDEKICVTIRRGAAPCHNLRFKTDADGRVVERTITDTDSGTTLLVQTMKYDEYGNLLEREDRDSSGKLLKKVSAQYSRGDPFSDKTGGMYP